MPAQRDAEVLLHLLPCRHVRDVVQLSESPGRARPVVDLAGEMPAQLRDVIGLIAALETKQAAA